MNEIKEYTEKLFEDIKYIDENGNEQCSTYIEPNFSAKGNYFPNMIEIVDGDYTIVEGRFYSQEEIDDHENVVLISKALAEENGLRVGDTLKVYTYSPSDVDPKQLSELKLVLDIDFD